MAIRMTFGNLAGSYCHCCRMSPNVAAKMVNVVTSYNGVIPGGGSGSSPGTSFQEAVQEQENQLRTVADRNGIGSAAD